MNDPVSPRICEVVDAASTKLTASCASSPGKGWAGHCLSVDPSYLSWRASSTGPGASEFIELAGKINQQMPYHSVSKVERLLNEAGKPVNGSKIAVLGVSHKPGVGDTRESPALKILSLLKALGAELAYHDEFVPDLPRVRPAQSRSRRSRGRRPGAHRHAHPGVDHDAAVASVPLALDLRGITRNTGGRSVLL